jgi:hypothetical protein
MTTVRPLCQAILLSRLLWVMSPFVASGQQSQVMREFYQLEQENWREYYEASKNLPLASNFDVKFYHLKVDLTVATPYIQGNCCC